MKTSHKVRSSLPARSETISEVNMGVLESWDRCGAWTIHQRVHVPEAVSEAHQVKQGCKGSTRKGQGACWVGNEQEEPIQGGRDL